MSADILIAYHRIPIQKHNEIMDSTSRKPLLVKIIVFSGLGHCHVCVSVLIKLYIRYSISAGESKICCYSIGNGKAFNNSLTFCIGQLENTKMCEANFD